MNTWWHFVLAIAGTLFAALVCLGFLIAAWQGIDRREAARHYSGPDRRRPTTGDDP